MTKCLISVLGVCAVLLLHGCATVPEPKPQPAPEPRAQAAGKPPAVPPQPAVSKPPKAIPQPAVIHRLADTGVEWVTGTSDLKSQHRFQLAEHTVEVSHATRYEGGSAADIDVGARLRAVGVYRDDVIVADMIYIQQSAQSVPAQTATEAEAPSTTARHQSQMETSAAAHPPPDRAPSVPAAPTSPGKLTNAKAEKTATKPPVPESAEQPKSDKAKDVITPPAKPSAVAAEKESTKVAVPPKVNSPSTKASGAQPSAAEAPSAAVKNAPSLAKPRESMLAKTEPSIKPPRPATSEPEAVKPAGPSAGATATKDFSHLVFDDRILPMSLDRGWTLDRQRDLVDGATRCVLLSPEFPIFDGYYPAKIWLRVNPARAWVETDSNIDTSYPKQGLRVDGGALAPFAKELVDEQTAYTDAPVLHGMAEGHTLTVALGFWPTWPKTKTQTASIDLAGFANAYAALQACSQQQQAASD